MSGVKEKAKKLMQSLPCDDYRYRMAEHVATTRPDWIGHNAALIVERTYALLFGKRVDRTEETGERV